MKIIIDVTETALSRLNTGVQRVVREVIRNAPKIERSHSIKIIPAVTQYDGNLYELEDIQFLLNTISHKANASLISILMRPILFLFRMLPIAHNLAQSIVIMLRRYLLMNDKRLPACDIKINPEAGDVLILLDSFWNSGRIIDASREFHRRGGLVFLVIYDLIPISHPQFFANKVLVRQFRNKLLDFLSFIDGIIAISEASANQVKQFITDVNIPNAKNVPIEYFHLGADFSSRSLASETTRSWPEKLWDDSDPVFMMVGTLEPRKGHAFVLDTFETRWEQGCRDKLLIIGRVGWSSGLTIRRIQSSPYFGSMLFMINDATDSELEHAYMHAYACIIASYVEGFGLPLIEALHRGIPVLASDIPVFREIGLTYCNYFTLGDSTSLNDAIDYLHANNKEIRSSIKAFHWLNWEQATDQLISKVIGMTISEIP